MGGKRINLVGCKFNRWTVISKTDKRKSGSIIWNCICDCGTIGEVRTAFLNNGFSKSCGCLQREIVTEIGKRAITHGHTRGGHKSPTYAIWERAKCRATNPNTKDYKWYGHKGICERWKKFENFLSDMGEKPDGHDIHRKDNNKGYSPENCEWKEMILHRREHKIGADI